MEEVQLKWLYDPRQSAEPGWASVLTPLGASLHVPINSAAEDLCTEWQLLHSGRGALCLTDPLAWFTVEELARAPSGLVAELLAAGLRMDDFGRLLATDAAARAHILRVPDHLFCAEPEEWLHVGECVDLARRLEAREVARAAAKEALGE